MFYPEGGGQPADTGTLSTDDISVEVRDVQIEDGVVLHRTDEDPGKGDFVNGRVDTARRRQLMRHHTATHIVIHAAREVLGDHVRQAGAQKGVDSSRIDLRHYDRIDRETIKTIERVANEIVMENTSVTQGGRTATKPRPNTASGSTRAGSRRANRFGSSTSPRTSRPVAAPTSPGPATSARSRF